MVSGDKSSLTSHGVQLRSAPSWHFAVLFEGSTVEKEGGTLCGWAAFFHIRVICHERKPYKDRYAGCKEYSWRVRRRFSDFQELDAGLRAANILLPSAELPRRTFWRHLYPTEEFVKQRSEELHRFLDAALAAAAARAASDPDLTDLADVSSALPQFLGMAAVSVGSGPHLNLEPDPSGRDWAYPEDAEERHVALVHTLDRGVYVWGHLDTGSPTGTRLTRFDRQERLGDLSCTHAEARHSTVAKEQRPSAPARRRISSDLMSESISETHSSRGPSLTSSPVLLASSPPRCPSLCPSLFSSPAASLLPSPVASPAQSRCATPPRRGSLCGPCDETHYETLSFTSTSTADTEQSIHHSEMPPARPKPPSKAVWLEVDLDNECSRAQEHSQWWFGVLADRANRGLDLKACVKGASRVDSAGAAKQQAHNRAEARRKMIVQYEKAAALYRELSVMHEDLHTVLGYGVENKTLVIVQQTATNLCGLRSLPFTQQRCHRVLGQALKALARLHEQHVPHGHLSPESFLIEEGPLGPQARIAWTPGQRRPEGHASATLGFRGPGCEQGPADDIWSLACVFLVWWKGFDPVPHPWTQFAKSHRLQQEIRSALAADPPEIPKALLDLHLAAAAAEEPCHTFLSLLAQMLTRCLIWDPAERPSAEQLLQHRFFEQAL